MAAASPNQPAPVLSGSVNSSVMLLGDSNVFSLDSRLCTAGPQVGFSVVSRGKYCGPASCLQASLDHRLTQTL